MPVSMNGQRRSVPKRPRWEKLGGGKLLIDREIKEYVRKYKMLEPFSDHLNSGGVISWGLSSMGYDIRIADEFKIFQPDIRVRTLSPYEKGYIAAMIDGEGCIQFYNLGRNNGKKQAKIAIGNTSRELLEKVQGIIGTGNIYHQPSKNPRHADAYMFTVNRTTDIQCLLSQLYPFLIVKRKRALEALEHFNQSSVIIDPKQFNPDSFIDFRGKECVIPPNSFALAKTVEYFRIPRNVLTVTTGKSTYARCGLIVNVTPFEPGWEGYAVLEVSNTTPLPAKIYANEGIAQVLFFASEEPCEVSYGDRKGKYQKQQSIVLPKVLK